MPLPWPRPRLTLAELEDEIAAAEQHRQGLEADAARLEAELSKRRPAEEPATRGAGDHNDDGGERARGRRARLAVVGPGQLEVSVGVSTPSTPT